jgi:hypothetical protein
MGTSTPPPLCADYTRKNRQYYSLKVLKYDFSGSREFFGGSFHPRLPDRGSQKPPST